MGVAKRRAGAYFEAGGAPVHELDGPLVLHARNGRVHVLGHHVPTVEQTDGHVFAPARVALDHLVVGLEASGRDVRHAQLLVVGLLGGHHRGVGDEREVDPGVRHQIRLQML